MKLLLKILKHAAIVIAGIMIVLFIAASLVQDKVADIILKSFSNDISTKFETGSVKLSFIKKFPKATLDLKNVLVHSSPGFDRKTFGGLDTDTLLSARSVIMEFRIRNIINGNYTIERIGVKNGSLRILTDTSGLVNYEIKALNPSESENDMNINLEGIHLTDIRAVYDNRATNLLISGIMENGRLRSKIAGDNIDFTGKGDLIIDNFSFYNFRINKNINTKINVNLNKSQKEIRFGRSTVVFDNNTISMNGAISSKHILDLAIKGENIDISNLKNYLPDNLIKKVSAYNPAGLFEVEGTISGKAARTSNPEINIMFALKDGKVTYKPASPAIQNVSFNGSFTNGSLRNPQSSSLKINNFRGKLGSSVYTGSFTLSNFRSLRCNFDLNGILLPAELCEFFNMKMISRPEGSVEMNLRGGGKIGTKKKIIITDLFSIITEGKLKFNSFGMGLNKETIRIENVTGLITASGKITAKDLDMTYNGQRLKINGTFTGLPQWIAGDNVTFQASGSLIANSLIADSFLPKKTTAYNDPGKKQPFSLPGDVVLDMNFNIGNLKYKTFEASNVSGTMTYKPRVMNFNNLNINYLDGFISGDGFFLQNADKSHLLKGSFSLRRINVNKAFNVFNNFGQSFIRHENLEGILSGSLKILIPMNRELKPSVKSMTAEGKYILEKGALVNFEPVKKLSEFIDISELENIRFEELANDFFIRNNLLYIPQMDVRSTAADLSINGRHGFDNNYEYHIKILLSQILSKKIPKPKPRSTEFGAIQDDGLGRTSLLLKIENKGDEVKVSYDVKAAGSQIRNEIKKEKQSLKTILNEEYGWFSNDTTAPVKSSGSGTPRIKVTWEETDTAKLKSEEPPATRQDFKLKNLFRKK